MADTTTAQAPAPASTGGTIAQLRAASQAGQLPGVQPAPVARVAPPVAQPEQSQGEVSEVSGDLETLGHDNASEQEEQDTQEPEQEVQEAEPGEQSWSDQELYGISAKDAFEALQKGEIPPELAKNIKVMAKVNGVEIPVSIEEATKGYQRLADYSRQKNELREQAQQVQGIRDSFESMVQSWKSDPAQLRKGMVKLGLQEPLFETAKLLATEWLQEQQLPPAERALRAQLKAMEEQHQELMQRFEQKQPQQHNERVGQLTQQLGIMVPQAMAQAGVPDSPVARTYIAENLKALWEPGTDLTEEIVQQAAQATAEQLGDMARQHASQRPQATKPKALPFRPQAAAAPAQTTVGRPGQKTGTIADFKKQFGTR